jgi:cytochrome P450 monooxygenase
MFTAPLSITILFITLLYWVGRAYLNYLRYERTAAQFGCPPLKRYPGWDRILGLDYVHAMFKALKEDRFIEFQTEAHSARDSKVWTANFMGNRMVYSSEPENMKALSTLQKDCFTVEPIRVAYGAITPFTGRGVSSSDDAKWQSSRDLVKPYFERAGFSNLERLSRHVGRLLSKIPMKRKVTMISGGSRWLEDVLI